jgi:hypothetical protein
VASGTNAMLKMAIHYRKARSDDTNSLGGKAGAYIPKVYGRLEHDSLLGNRHRLGFEHRVTARMLCPREKLDLFDQDSTYAPCPSSCQLLNSFLGAICEN